jgi:hypothetical protein
MAIAKKTKKHRNQKKRISTDAMAHSYFRK